MAQYYLYDTQQKVLRSEGARQLIGKLTGPTQTWYIQTLANDLEATESQIALRLRRAFGQEYVGVWALWALYHVSPSPTQSDTQRLLALDHCEEQHSRCRPVHDTL